MSKQPPYQPHRNLALPQVPGGKFRLGLWNNGLIRGQHIHQRRPVNHLVIGGGAGKRQYPPRPAGLLRHVLGAEGPRGAKGVRLVDNKGVALGNLITAGSGGRQGKDLNRGAVLFMGRYLLAEVLHQGSRSKHGGRLANLVSQGNGGECLAGTHGMGQQQVSLKGALYRPFLMRLERSGYGGLL